MNTWQNKKWEEANKAQHPPIMNALKLVYKVDHFPMRMFVYSWDLLVDICKTSPRHLSTLFRTFPVMPSCYGIMLTSERGSSCQPWGAESLGYFIISAFITMTPHSRCPFEGKCVKDNLNIALNNLEVWTSVQSMRKLGFVRLDKLYSHILASNINI